MPVQHIIEDDDFQAAVAQAGSRLIVMDFFATWCGPCRTIAPFFETLSSKHSAALFLKIDVDKAQECAAQMRVRAMPTFVCWRSGRELERLEGANTRALEAMVEKHLESGASDATGDSKSSSLNSQIRKAGSECLNQDDDHPFQNIWDDDARFLQSDCDEQLLLTLEFQQPARIASLQFFAPADSGPKRVRLFINYPGSLDFDKAASMQSVQDVLVEPRHLGGEALALKFVKFQNVQTLHLFVQDNQGGGEVTRLRHLVINGSTIGGATDMGQFKRVAGKEGESH